MWFSSWLPSRCLCCAEPVDDAVLCRRCLARYQQNLPEEPLERLCPVCGQVKLSEQARCMDCSTQAWSFPSIDGLFGYQEATAELLRLYKFGGLSPLVRAWAAAAAFRLVPAAPLVPVPPLRKNLLRRGWDPVATLARSLGRSARVPVWPVLERRPSASQKGLDRQQRKNNAATAYRIRPGRASQLRGVPQVWLVDDVVTTGATVEACARLLVDAGVGEVRVFCLGLH